MSATEIVHASFEAYLAQDRTMAERLLADALVFTSPQDDHIDKAAYLERCFPTADRLNSQEILELVSTGGDDVFHPVRVRAEDGRPSPQHRVHHGAR